jgi:hypothetical protein
MRTPQGMFFVPDRITLAFFTFLAVDFVWGLSKK